MVARRRRNNCRQNMIRKHFLKKANNAVHSYSCHKCTMMPFFAESHLEKMSRIDETACDAKAFGRDCPGGSWCCLNGTSKKTECVPCDQSIFGHCLQTSKQLCESHKMTSWNQMADVEEFLYNAGKELSKEAMHTICVKYGITCPV